MPFLLQMYIQYSILLCMKRISVFLTEQQIAALKDMAAQTGLKFAELVRRLIDKALEEFRERHRRGPK